MGLNETPSGERTRIAFLGCRNAGKSSLVNAVAGQSLSVVSPISGTTTDPVRKAMEILPLGPVLIVDTPGFDDEGELGSLRVQKTQQEITKADAAVLVIDAKLGLTEKDRTLTSLLKERRLPFITVFNKSDLLDVSERKSGVFYVSSMTGENVNLIRERLGQILGEKKEVKPLVSDLILSGKTSVLVVPIDESAPKGRLILPQQETIRDLLDSHARVVVCQPEELSETLLGLKEPPSLVITDSQAFEYVAKVVPPSIPLTSFSILFARYKGELERLVSGASCLSHLHDGDKVLIAESCTHHRQCNDIGTVKLPKWIKSFSHANPSFSFSSGADFPLDLSSFSLIVHCGGCMITATEMKDRVGRAVAAGVPTVNYGIAIAHMHGLLSRSLELFPEIKSLLPQ